MSALESFERAVDAILSSENLETELLCLADTTILSLTLEKDIALVEQF